MRYKSERDRQTGDKKEITKDCMKRSNNISVYWYMTPHTVVSEKPAASEASVLTYQHTKIKVTFTLEQAMKAQRGSRRITLLFL